MGRNVFNIWRLMRSELALYSYTQENVVMTVLNQVSAYTEVMTRLDLLRARPAFRDLAV